MSLQIIPIKIQKEIGLDVNLVDLILESSEINDGDILVFSQKIVSKNEGRVLSLSSVNPSLLANGIASSYGKDPRLVELILSESKRIVRMENGIIIVEPGLRIGDLLGVIMPHNWVLVGLSGSIDDVVGGVLSTNTHGKDTWKNGNFSQNIVSFKIIFANGTTKEIQKDKDSELFNSIVGGLGFLGLITEIH